MNAVPLPTIAALTATGFPIVSVATPLAPIAREGKPAPDASLGALQVRLWYEGTGNLSPNIAPPAKFVARNIIVGEGDATENAKDALFTADVLSGEHEVNVNVPLVLTVRKADGTVLASRRIVSILTSKKGRAVQGLWVSNIGCAGDLIFEADLGSAHRRVKVSLKCGE